MGWTLCPAGGHNRHVAPPTVTGEIAWKLPFSFWYAHRQEVTAVGRYTSHPARSTALYVVLAAPLKLIGDWLEKGFFSGEI